MKPKSAVATSESHVGLPSRSREFRLGLVPRHGYELLSAMVDANKNLPVENKQRRQKCPKRLEHQTRPWPAQPISPECLSGSRCSESIAPPGMPQNHHRTPSIAFLPAVSPTIRRPSARCATPSIDRFGNQRIDKRPRRQLVSDPATAHWANGRHAEHDQVRKKEARQQNRERDEGRRLWPPVIHANDQHRDRARNAGDYANHVQENRQHLVQPHAHLAAFHAD